MDFFVSWTRVLENLSLIYPAKNCPNLILGSGTIKLKSRLWIDDLILKSANLILNVLY